MAVDLMEAMEAAGWTWEAKTLGFTKKVPASSHPMMEHVTETLWVSSEQAGACLRAAEGETVRLSPASRTVAAILAKGVANE